MWGTERSPFQLTDHRRHGGLRGVEKMDQLGNFGGAAKQVAHLVHENVTGIAGMELVPTMIVVSLAALFGLVGLVVGGAGRRPRGAHRA